MQKINMLLLIIFMLVGCRKEQNVGAEYVHGVVEKTSKEFLIPRDLRAHIEKQYLQFIRKENPKIVLPDEEITARIPREFLNVSIFLRASAPGVLRNHTEYKLPRGGGEIDLKDVVTGTKGSFFLTYQLARTSAPDVLLKDVHVYFAGEVKKRKIDGQEFGSGCNTFMEVTEQMQAANASGGLQLNATAQRYLPVIGGVFYFVDFNPERKMYLASVRIKDTRYPESSCQE
jgi:hypothetical protein